MAASQGVLGREGEEGRGGVRQPLTDPWSLEACPVNPRQPAVTQGAALSCGLCQHERCCRRGEEPVRAVVLGALSPQPAPRCPRRLQQPGELWGCLFALRPRNPAVRRLFPPHEPMPMPAMPETLWLCVGVARLGCWQLVASCLSS